MSQLRLRDLGRWYSGGTPPRESPEHWDGDLPWISAKDINSTRLRAPTTFITRGAATSHSRVVPAGSLLMIVRGMALAHGLPVVQTHREVAFNQDLRALVCGPGIDPRYVYYALIGNRWRLDAHIDRAAHGTARVVDSVYSERIRVPTPDEQREIAEFLDLECARIDALRTELAELLEVAATEHEHHVESGLHEHAARFGATKLGRFAQVLSGYAFPSDGFRQEPQSAVRLLRGVNVAPGTLRWDDVVYWPEADTRLLARFALRVDDVVIGMDRPWISSGFRVATITAADVPALLLQRVGCLRPRGTGLDMQYAKCWLESAAFRSAVEADLTGVSVPHISPDQITSFRVAVPPIDVQKEFVHEVDADRAGLNSLRHEIARITTSLFEYRDSLITEAVAGKLPILA